MTVRHKIHVLKITGNDEKKEIQFELDFLNTLTIAERFEMMFNVSRRMKEMYIQNGHRYPTEIIKRV